MVDLMAAVPSVIYGLWGFFILQPFLTARRWFLSIMAFIPFFRVAPARSS